MSRSRKATVVLRVLQLFGLGAAIGAGVVYVNWLLAIDPLAKFRTAQKRQRADEIGLQLGDVEFAIWDGSKQVGTCLAKRIDVRRDRQRTDLFEISNGRIFTEKGDFTFTAPHASYEQRKQYFAALKGAKLKGKDIDLTVDGFSYHRRMDRLQTVGKVKGKFFGGNLLATNLVYLPKEDAFSAGPIRWEGPGTKFAGELPGIKAQTRWTINADHSKAKGDIITYLKGHATDGEVIIKANTIVHDRKTDVITATGDVLYYSAKANMTCEKVTVYRKERRALLEGSVTMLIKPKDLEKIEEAPIPPFRPIVPEAISANRPTAPTPSDKDQNEAVRQGNSFRKYPTQLWAERIEYFYAKGSRRANISGSPQARQELPNGGWRHVWTNTAFYDAEGESLKLNSTPGKRDTKVRNSAGDDLIAEWFKVSTRENQEDEWEAAGLSGIVVSDDEPGSANPPASQPPPLSGRIGG
jgi:hypothetical protein